VKFQTFKAEKLASKHSLKAEYQVKNINDGNTSQIDMLRKLELKADAYPILIDYCKRKKIAFLSTPFDEESIDFLAALGIDLFKIPSGEITNFPYLRKIGSFGKPIIMSTGMADLAEIEDALKILVLAGATKDDITILHCNTEYPTPIEDVNLTAMNTIAKTFNIKIGYSDHTLGLEVPIAAVALGATVIEKHFTLDKTMEGPDHRASLEPGQLKAMVVAIRNIEKALGDGIKKPSASESKNIEIARKSVHLMKDLRKGHIITEDDLIMKRPGNGIASVFIEKIIGKKLNADFEEDYKLKWEDFS
jgi:N,N'-diacetyllegionaminate synthase